MAAVGGMALAGCASVTSGGGGGEGSDSPGSSPSVTVSQEPSVTASQEPSAPPSQSTSTEKSEVVGSGMLFQRSAQDPVVLCVGGVAESMPPQCSGPRVIGDDLWQHVASEAAQGARWSTDTVYAVGHLDLDDGSEGTVSLTRDLSTTPPASAISTLGQASFSQLCDDPREDLDEQAPPAPDPQQTAALATLLEQESAVPGFVSLHVSGNTLPNVVVTTQTDLQQARQQIREVYSGPLCLVKQDQPPRKDVLAAQDAVVEALGPGRLLGAGTGSTGGLEVQVVFADAATRQAVHDAVAPWLTPDEVTITGAFQELSRTSG